MTLGVDPAAQMEVAGQVTAIMLRRVADAAALSEMLTDDRLNAVCLGPGIGVGAQTQNLVTAALNTAASDLPDTKPRGVVLDADALTSILSACFARAVV